MRCFLHLRGNPENLKKECCFDDQYGKASHQKK